MILYVRYSVRFLLWAMLAAGKTEWSLVAIGDVNKREWQGDRVQQLHRVSKKSHLRVALILTYTIQLLQFKQKCY